MVYVFYPFVSTLCNPLHYTPVLTFWTNYKLHNSENQGHSQKKIHKRNKICSSYKTIKIT